MVKKSISSLELAALIGSLQHLIRGKVSQIYHQEKRELLLQLHAPGKGKQLLKIIPGKYLCITKEKSDASRPTGFCMLLRKYLGNASIKSIYQQDADRIVVFEFGKKETFFLIVELFSKGNIILTTADHIILGVLQWQKWRDRVVKPKEKYLFPEPGVNWKTISEKELKDILKKSEKKNLATSLATEVNLGGVYAEEACKIAEIDKDLKPHEVKDVKPLLGAIKEMITLIEKPEGFFYEGDITPFALKDQEIKEKMGSYHEAINTINPYQVTSPYENRINTIKRMIAQQEEAILSQEENIDTQTKRGELIYEKYAPLQKMLDIVKEMRKTKGWDEVASALQKEKSIKEIDLKNKKVMIEL